MNPKFLVGQTAAAYHASPGASASRLNLLRRKSPLHVQYSTQHPSEPTPALVLGEAVHCLVLEPSDFTSRYTKAGPCAARTKQGEPCSNGGKVFDGEWYCGVHGKGRTHDEGRKVLDDDTYRQAELMAKSVVSHPTASRLLSLCGHREMSIYWQDELTDCDCKARIDAIGDRGIIVDLKTTEDASPDGFAKSIANYGYDLQAYHYLAGANATTCKAEHFFFVAVEKTPPYAVGIYRITDENLSAMHATYQRLLNIYDECARSGVWPGYPEAADVQVPAWGMKRLELASV